MLLHVCLLVCLVVEEVKVRRSLVHHTVAAGDADKGAGELAVLGVLIGELGGVKDRSDGPVVPAFQGPVELALPAVDDDAHKDVFARFHESSGVVELGLRAVLELHHRDRLVI